MEKISHIVGGSARVGATDNMNAPAVRPGAQAFGRPIGVSPHSEHSSLSTAQRAVAIQDDMLEHQHMRAEGRAAADMGPQFFARAKAEGLAEHGSIGPRDVSAGPSSGEHDAYVAGDEPVLQAAPSKYMPRGSYIDVHA